VTLARTKTRFDLQQKKWELGNSNLQEKNKAKQTINKSYEIYFYNPTGLDNGHAV
jgi:uncharacterized protein YcfL